MKNGIVGGLALVLALVSMPHAMAGIPAPDPATSCVEGGPTRAELDRLKAGGYEVADASRRQRLALDLVECLGAPDPALRDGLAYEGLAKWMRADALSVDTRTTMLARLQRDVADAAPPGFRAPFAALVLSEVARTDRIAAWLTPEQRDALVATAATYVEGVRDYRGYDEAEGWRHGVAHGADLLMQLALNKALDKGQLDRILGAVAHQVAPTSHFYIYGEPGRLSRPVVFVLQRGQHDDGAWQAWLARLTGALAARSEALGMQARLAQRHNTRAFLLALYAALAGSSDAALTARAPAVAEALRAMD
jgi:hypothetical protein